MSEKRCKPPWLSFEARIEAVGDISIFRAFFIFGAFIDFLGISLKFGAGLNCNMFEWKALQAAVAKL